MLKKLLKNFLFPKHKQVMKGHNLGTVIEIRAELSHMVKEIPAKYHQASFHAWKQYMHKCVCASRGYFEEDYIDNEN